MEIDKEVQEASKALIALHEQIKEEKGIPKGSGIGFVVVTPDLKIFELSVRELAELPDELEGTREDLPSMEA